MKMRTADNQLSNFTNHCGFMANNDLLVREYGENMYINSDVLK